MFDIQQIEYLLEEKFDTLSEAQREYLLENRIEFIKNANKDKISTEHDPESAKLSSDKIVDTIANKIDPTSNKAHTQWLVNRYKAGDFTLKNGKKVKQTLEQYETAKPFMENKDLNSMKSLMDLKDNIAPTTILMADKDKEEKESTVENMPLLYESEGVKGYSLPNKATSRANFNEFSGKLEKTKWCTAWKTKRNMFDGYRGGKYPISLPNGEWLQLHHQSGQLQDKENAFADITSDKRFSPYKNQIIEFMQKTHDMEGNPQSQLVDRYVGTDSNRISKLIDDHENKLKDLSNYLDANKQVTGYSYAYRDKIRDINFAHAQLIKSIKRANLNDDVFDKLKSVDTYTGDTWNKPENEFSDNVKKEDLSHHLAESKFASPHHLDYIASTIPAMDNKTQASDTLTALMRNDNTSSDTHHALIGHITSDKNMFGNLTKDLANDYMQYGKNITPEHFERLDPIVKANSANLAIQNDSATIPTKYLNELKDDHSVKYKIAARKEITPEISEHILENSNPILEKSMRALRNLATNNAVSANVAKRALDKIADSDNGKMTDLTIKNYINREDATPESISHLVSHISNNKLASEDYNTWAGSHRLSRSDIQQLTKSDALFSGRDHALVFSALINNPKLKSDDLSTMMNHPKFEINKHASKIISSDAAKSKNVDELLAKNAHSAVADYALNDMSSDIITPNHVATLLTSDINHHQKLRLLSHPKNQLSHFNKVKDDIRFAGAISNSKNAPPSILHSLATSPMDHVRRNIAENTNTESKTYDILKTDANEDIRNIAEKKGAKK